MERDKESSPSICIASSGSKRDLPCNYDNLHFLFADDEGISAPELFNSFYNKRDFDAYIFLSENYEFTDENSINNIVEALFHIDPQVDALYTDILARIKGKTTLLKPQPMASKYMFNSGNIMNIPFAVKKRCLPKFNEKFNHLFLHTGLVEVFKTSLLVHYPKFCFTVNNFTSSSGEMNREMEMLKNGEY
jgi:hypothetical protein